MNLNQPTGLMNCKIHQWQISQIFKKIDSEICGCFSFLRSINSISESTLIMKDERR